MSSNGAFLGLEVELPVAKVVHYFLEEDQVFLEGPGVNHNIINVNVESFPNHVSENFVHGMLKCRGGIAETEWHPCKFVMSIRGNESRSFDSFFCHANLVITHEQVECGEVVHFRRHLL